MCFRQVDHLPKTVDYMVNWYLSPLIIWVPIKTGLFSIEYAIDFNKRRGDPFFILRCCASCCVALQISMVLLDLDTSVPLRFFKMSNMESLCCGVLQLSDYDPG